MGDSFTLQDFTKADIPSGYSKEIRDVIVMAVGVGWTLYLGGTGDSVTLAPPVEGRKKIHLGKHRSSKSVAQLRRTVLKDGDPELVAVVDEAMSKGTTVGLARLRRIGDPGTIKDVTQPEKAQPIDDDCPRHYRREPHRPHIWFGDEDREMVQPLQCAGVAREKNPVLTREQAKEVLTKATEERKEATKVATVQTSEPHVVSIRPMQAKKAEGRVYDSDTTNERLWSDGSKDFQCRYPDCTSGEDGGPYTTTNRQGVKAHWQKHKGEAPKARQTGYYAGDTSEATHYRPRQARVDTLADVLEKAWKEYAKTGEAPDFGELATTALTWVHEQSNQGTGLAAEREPMTADEIVVRIRTLLDDGTKGSLLSETEALRLQVEDLHREVDDVTAQRDRARETLRGLAELASDEMKEAAGA